MKVAKIQLKNSIRRARRGHWAQFVQKCEKSAKNSFTMNPKIHRIVKKGIRPLRPARSSMKIGNEILSQREVEVVWPAYLESQTGWDGPVSSDTLPAHHRGVPITSEQGKFDNEECAEAARIVRQHTNSCIGAGQWQKP